MSTETPRDEGVDDLRRRLLRSSAILGGTFVVGHLPYRSPVLRSFFGVRNAYAQLSGPLMITLNGQLGTMMPPAMQNTGQDAWQFTVQANTALTIMVTHDGNQISEVGLFEPGVPTTGTNALNGTSAGVVVASGGMVNHTAVMAGTWTFAIEDDKDDADELNSTYTVKITGDKPLGAPTQTINEGAETLRPG